MSVRENGKLLSQEENKMKELLKQKYATPEDYLHDLINLMNRIALLGSGSYCDVETNSDKKKMYNQNRKASHLCHEIMVKIMSLKRRVDILPAKQAYGEASRLLVTALPQFIVQSKDRRSCIVM